MSWRLEILPPGQRAFWATDARAIPERFVLYGGTAVALRCGHRQSVDFDFFTDGPLDEPDLREQLRILEAGTVLRRDRESLVLSVPIADAEVKLSFFANLDFGRVGVPERDGSTPWVASPLDLLATKLKVLQERIEPKDYLDIDALIESGVTLTEGLAALAALYGRQVNPLDAAKAVSWFKEDGLETTLPEATRQRLRAAVAAVTGELPTVKILSRSLAPA